MERKQIYWEDVEVDQEIPTGYSLKIDITRMVMQVSGTQDYYAVHHDRDFAHSQGVPDIFLNTGFLTAAAGRLLTDWIGTEGSLKKFRIEMRRMNLLGDTMWVKGKVTDLHARLTCASNNPKQPACLRRSSSACSRRRSVPGGTRGTP